MIDKGPGSEHVGAAERFYTESHKRRLPSGTPDEIQHQVERDRLALTGRCEGHRYSSVYQFMKSHPGLQVAELGFGFTALLPVLAGHAGTLTIVDIVDRRESANLPANVLFKKADLNDEFPFADQTFDVSIAMMVVEHLFDPFHSFAQLARVTRQGGKVFINVPNIASLRCRYELFLGQMPVTSSRDWFERREWDGNHLHNFTVKDVLRLAGISGLKLDKIHPVGKAIWLKSLRPSLFCHEISYEFSRL